MSSGRYTGGAGLARRSTATTSEPWRRQMWFETVQAQAWHSKVDGCRVEEQPLMDHHNIPSHPLRSRKPTTWDHCFVGRPRRSAGLEAAHQTSNELAQGSAGHHLPRQRQVVGHNIHLRLVDIALHLIQASLFPAIHSRRAQQSTSPERGPRGRVLGRTPCSRFALCR